MRFCPSVRATFALLLVVGLAGSSLAVISGMVKLPANPPASAEKLLGTPSFAGFSPTTLPAGWQLFRHSLSGSLAVALGAPVDVGVRYGDDGELKQVAERIASQYSELIAVGDCEINAVQVLHAPKTTTVLVRLDLEGVEVYGAYVAVTFSRDEKMVSVKGDGFGSLNEGSFGLKESEAGNFALEILGLKQAVVSSVRRVWLPEAASGTIRLRAADEVKIVAEDTQLRPVVYLDAETGKLLAAENRICYDQLPGQTVGMSHTNYGPDREVRWGFPNEWLSLDIGLTAYSDTAGAFLVNVPANAAPFTISTELRGRWVDVNNNAGADASQQVRMNQIQNVELLWNNDNSRADERMLFRQTNFIHSFYKQLDPGFRGMDYAVPAACQVGDHYDNAYWDGNGINFGAGGQMDNFALYADVIQHEYTHGVTGHIYPWDVLPYQGESGALNEAWSDYFPCSISNEPYMGEGGLTRDGGYIRCIENELTYPLNITGEVHADSRIVSAAMWHSRAVLGRELADSLMHFSKYQLGNTFLAWFTDVLRTDDNDGNISNGTPHDLVLYEQFGRHGIGPGIHPQLVIRDGAAIFDDNQRGASGNSNKFWEPGEVIRIEVTVERLGSLFPPPAENVRVTLTTESPSLEVVRDVAQIGELRVGDSHQGAQPFLVRIRDDAPLSFANLYLTISADGEPNLGGDTLRIPLGLPHVLLVNDGPGVDRSQWFREAFDRDGVVFDEQNTFDNQLDLASWMQQFRSVVWFTGDAGAGILSDQNRQLLTHYLDAGGRVLLTGQYIARQPGIAGFLQGSFGSRVVTDSIRQVYLEGVVGDSVGKGLHLLLLGGRGAMNQRAPASIAGVNGGVEVFHWTRDPESPAGGVRFENDQGGKTVFLSFGLEAISGQGSTNSRADLLRAVLEWFGEPTSAPTDPTYLPGQFALDQPYPNPFNAQTKIGFVLPKESFARLAVYDITGRLAGELADGHFAAGQHTVNWNGAGYSTGLYFLRLEAGGMTQTRKMMLVK